MPRADEARRRLFFPRLVTRVFSTFSAWCAAQPTLRGCYSVKTNPRPEILSAARRAGILAEVIGPREFDHALACGFSPPQIVYNGPYPVTHCRAAPGFFFADSIEAFIAAAKRFDGPLRGVRLRPPEVPSHFGIAREQIAALCQALGRTGTAEIGISFHVRPQDYGNHSFRSLAEAVMEFGAQIERSSGARVVAFDTGGGKRPEEFDAAIESGEFAWLQTRVQQHLPHVRVAFCEPGQALVTTSEALEASVLEVRRNGPHVDEVVVDAGYPDVPNIGSFEHRLFLMVDGRARRLRQGRGRIVGRTCLEYDVLATGVDLEESCAGARLLIADAGAYDSSMRFSFAEGAPEEASLG